MISYSAHEKTRLYDSLKNPSVQFLLAFLLAPLIMDFVNGAEKSLGQDDPLTLLLMSTIFSVMAYRSFRHERRNRRTRRAESLPGGGRVLALFNVLVGFSWIFAGLVALFFRNLNTFRSYQSGVASTD